GPAAVHRVEAHEVRERRRVGDVVHPDELDRRLALHGRAHHLPPDATEAVDADTKRHDVPSSPAFRETRPVAPAQRGSGSPNDVRNNMAQAGGRNQSGAARPARTMEARGARAVTIPWNS